MTLMSRVAILAISLVSMCAQAKQPSAVKLKADAQNVAKIISGDKFKTQAYCEIVELGGQIDESKMPRKLRSCASGADQVVIAEYLAPLMPAGQRHEGNDLAAENVRARHFE